MRFWYLKSSHFRREGSLLILGAHWQACLVRDTDLAAPESQDLLHGHPPMGGDDTVANTSWDSYLRIAIRALMKLAVEDPTLAKGDPAFGAKLITGLHLIYCFRLRLARICRALIATHCGDLSNDRRGCFNQWIVSNQAHRSLKAPALLVWEPFTALLIAPLVKWHQMCLEASPISTFYSRGYRLSRSCVSEVELSEYLWNGGSVFVLW